MKYLWYLIAFCQIAPMSLSNIACRSYFYVPLRSSFADFAICINVIHHLTTEEWRYQCMHEIVRLLCCGSAAIVEALKNLLQREMQDFLVKMNKHEEDESSIGFYHYLLKENLNFCLESFFAGNCEREK